MKKNDCNDFKNVLEKKVKKFYLTHGYKNCVKKFEKYRIRTVCKKCKIALVLTTLTQSIFFDLSDFNHCKHDSTVDSNS